MNLPDRHLLLGMTLGALCATAMAATGLGAGIAAFAEELTPAAPAIDPANLVRFEDRDYTVDYEGWVATDPLSNARVKKIEAGKVSYVSITTTDTGTYSTDAMFSPHVRYPGITVEVADTVRNAFSEWLDGHWSEFSSSDAGSFTFIHFER